MMQLDNEDIQFVKDKTISFIFLLFTSQWSSLACAFSSSAAVQHLKNRLDRLDKMIQKHIQKLIVTESWIVSTFEMRH
ncbi:putative lipoprotein [Trichinella spiralis]|uniref:putative lipoprotein n=1 Tax=Trichinella spiralis TaxID=6334 RepID=UPI0001EFED17|nr:putative lipoprotein [Trichinella spiralis]